MINFDFYQSCYGCGVCEEVCPTKAITLTENPEGFLSPNINNKACINCGKCDKYCVRLKNYESINIKNSEFHAVYLKDKNLRKLSTSGGAFYAFALQILNEGGIVCGCVWDDSMSAKIIATDRYEILERMRGSKYVQSRIECFEEIKIALNQNRKVLFSGLPCQVAAIQSVFGCNENLITISLLCEGASSPLAWRKYKKELESRFSSKMINAIHRKCGKYGWLSPMAEYEFADGRVHKTLSFTLDKYVHNMIYGYFTKNACYNCQFKGDNSTADILIGDFWGLPNELLKKTENLGCSVISILTSKGKSLLDKVLQEIDIISIEFSDASRRNPPLLYSSSKNPKRDLVLSELSYRDFSEVIDKYCEMNTVKVKVQKILHFLGLAGIAKRILRR